MFERVKKNFGFGCMRFPMKNDEVDFDQLNEMVDYFMQNGFNYFDTAHGYLNGKSEIAVRECLAKRYPRSSYFLVNKLSNGFFEKKEDIEPFLDSQLALCGVEYFDLYLMHAQNARLFAKYKKLSAYETAFELKKTGKIRHVGISFHDTAEVLEEILATYPEIEVVQLQINYLDYDDTSIQGRKCLQVCNKYSKPVIVMEPVKGGNLVNLPPVAKSVFDELGTNSYASYAIRFSAGLKGVKMVLSGMSDMAQMIDNVSFMRDFAPLSEVEQEAVSKVVKIFDNLNAIGCTACRYCVSECVKNISIPDLFSCYNSKKIFNDWNAGYYYSVHTANRGKASDCIECGKCEKACPQKLEIRALLKEVATEFEGKDDEQDD